ncbi:hypothetical protein JMN32_15925 [Fulvivirga sp. 29W222]|uniref:Uncharacterized protein n=1 Tax=Fulvivirga marina TaxID=2494733 RepID=A0A937FZG5_9BACT|nr:hypothetical protein [Fulvivirga marina]
MSIYLFYLLTLFLILNYHKSNDKL